jgi:nucleoside-diphosphate-sugar epimerase
MAEPMEPEAPMNNTKVLIFGARSGIGVQLIETLRAAGAAAVGITRSGGGSNAAADVTDAGAVARVFAEHPDATAIVSIVGGRPFTKETPPDLTGNQNLIEAAERAGIRRFILVSTIGAGDSRAAAPLAARLVLGRFMKLKTEAENLLRTSKLDWSIVRPGHLKDGPPTGRAVLREDSTVSGAVVRADVGVLIAGLIADPASFGRTYASIEPKRN